MLTLLSLRRRSVPGKKALGQANFVAQIMIPTIIVVAAMMSLLGAFMVFTAQQGDRVASEKQRQVITTMLEYSIVRIAHDQEAKTVGDESVRRVRAAIPDLAWMDANLGIWLHSFYGHDEAFVVDGMNRPIYAMRRGVRVAPALYDRTVAAPLIAELRRKLQNPSKEDRTATTLTPGAADLADVDGHLAVVSVKPIISDSGDIPQLPGHQYLHISIRYLDGSFITDIARRFEVLNAHFMRKAPIGSDSNWVVLRTRAGRPLGYFTWSPYRPGTALIRRLAPALAITLIIVIAIVGLLLTKIRKNALQLVAANIRAQHLAFHDTLTGLANRALFEDRLGRALAKTVEGDRALALLLVDLDNFKKINDNLGHPVGDELIAALGSLLVRVVGPNDIVARIDADGFAVIHAGPSSATDIEPLCEQIIAAASDPFDIVNGRIMIGISIGVALAPHDGVDRIELVRKATIALYDAKLSGCGGYSMFNDAMDAKVRGRLVIESELRAAIEAGDQLEVLYQPYFSSLTMEIVGVEALVRWHHPERGLLMPSGFVPVAEECGLIEPLGEWVLEQACMAAAHWPSMTVSVNVSAVQLRNPEFAQRVFPILKRTRLDPTRLELEITETSFIESTEKSRVTLGRLRDIGVQLALDDFGTGYSSFRHLHEFDIDRIKVDQSFVNGIDLTTGGSAIIRAIVDLAKARGLRTTAEGVETEEQSHFLTSIGCNSQQGFLFARPLRQAEIDGLLVKTLA